jgi:4-amino-4-deoxy-L-arabinose transferase-like glycosyltransferase
MDVLRPREWTRARVLDGLAVVTLLCLAVIAAFTFRHYGLGWDDYTHAQMGELLLALYGSGFRDTRALSFVNLYMYGGGFDMLAALVAKLLSFDLFETRRLVGAGVGLIGLAVTWRIARRIGGPLAGLFALVLLALCPMFYGHMFMNPKDAPFAVAMAVLLLGLVRAFDEYPRPSPATVMLFGVGLGLTLGTRIMGGLAVLHAGAALLFLLTLETKASGLRDAARRFARFAWRLVPGLLVAYLLMGLLWPWSVVAPLNPLRAVEYFSHFFEKPWKEMFAGSLVSVPDMPWTYLPTLFLLKLPELLIALGAGGIVLTAARVADGSAPRNQRAIHLVVLGAALMPIALTLVSRPALYNGLRHFLFVLPPLAVLGGLAGARLVAWVSERGPRLRLAGAAVLLIALASPLIELVRLHPYEYTHFNRIAGGIRGANDRYMLDYWGLAFKQAGEELRNKLTERLETPTDTRKWKIAVCGPQRVAAVELGPEFETTWESRGADFALTLGEFYCADLKAPVLVEIEREGVVYARVYDIRGRSITTLLTVPPP